VLVGQGRDLLLTNWRLFKHVNENSNGESVVQVTVLYRPRLMLLWRARRHHGHR